MQGMLFGILTMNQNIGMTQTPHQIMIIKEQIYNTLSSLVRDNYMSLCGLMNQLLCESFDHLRFQVIEEIIWVVD